MAANVPATVLDEQGNPHQCCVSGCNRNGVPHRTEHLCALHIAQLPTEFCDAKCHSVKWPQSCDHLNSIYIEMYGL